MRGLSTEYIFCRAPILRGKPRPCTVHGEKRPSGLEVELLKSINVSDVRLRSNVELRYE